MCIQQLCTKMHRLPRQLVILMEVGLGCHTISLSFVLSQVSMSKILLRRYHQSDAVAKVILLQGLASASAWLLVSALAEGKAEGKLCLGSFTCSHCRFADHDITLFCSLLISIAVESIGLTSKALKVAVPTW